MGQGGVGYWAGGIFILCPFPGGGEGDGGGGGGCSAGAGGGGGIFVSSFCVLFGGWGLLSWRRRGAGGGGVSLTS